MRVPPLAIALAVALSISGNLDCSAQQFASRSLSSALVPSELSRFDNAFNPAWLNAHEGDGFAGHVYSKLERISTAVDGQPVQRPLVPSFNTDPVGPSFDKAAGLPSIMSSLPPQVMQEPPASASPARLAQSQSAPAATADRGSTLWLLALALALLLLGARGTAESRS